MNDNLRKKEKRITAIRKQMDKIPEMIEGSLLTKYNRTKRKDGSIRISQKYYTFQYRGADGNRKWQRIPKKAKTIVEQLVRAGKRYRKLEREYVALLTELSLENGGKKND